MKSFQFVWLSLALSIWLIGCQWTIEPAKILREDTVPVVETGDVIITTDLINNGPQWTVYGDFKTRVISLGYNTLTEFGIVYTPGNSTPTVQNSTKSIGYGQIGEGEFAYTRIRNLSFRTTYSYRAYAINNVGMIGYGAVKTLTTGESPPIVETIGLIGKPGVIEASAQCRVTNSSEVTLREYGIVYSTSARTFISNGIKVPASGTSGNTATVRLTGLKAYTLYYYRAYAINSYGLDDYGSEMTWV